MKKEKQVVLCDLDNTLSDTRHRAHLGVEADGKHRSHDFWIPYSKACTGDSVIESTAVALTLFREAGALIYLVSGRNVEAERETLLWLMENGIPFDSLRMRAPHDIQHNGEYKVAYVRELKEQGFKPILMLEDHEGVSELVAAEGVPVMTVNPRYVDPIGVNFNNLAV